jgi:tripartite-type tricarboxylate transporter receptor subunit TctC
MAISGRRLFYELHVPYRGGGPAIADAIAGQVQVVFIPAPAGIEYVRSGRLRALGISGASRFEALPDVPSVGEFVSGYEASTWYGVVAPRNTPSTIIDTLNKEINAGLAQPTLKARFAELGAEVFPGSPSDFSRLVVAETEKWAKVIRTANIKPE